MDTDRRVALVTGGSRGIGYGCAMHLAEAGFDLAINGVKPESEAADALQRIRDTGVQVVYCRGNIADKKDRDAILARVKGHFQGLHVLVNDAGVAPKERLDILETTEESFDFVVDINLRGSFFLTQAAANWMIAQKQTDADYQGCIINISSISATVASVNRGEYCISKAGLSMITKLFATRLGEHGLPVYEVQPGVIRTDMTAGVTEKYDQLFAEGLCVTPRWGLPEDIGKAVASLATGQFPYSTGQVVMVDGGLTLPRL